MLQYMKGENFECKYSLGPENSLEPKKGLEPEKHGDVIRSKISCLYIARYTRGRLNFDGGSVCVLIDGAHFSQQ